jgi:hypothetical protein
LFDAIVVGFDSVLVWIKLPSLPLEYWTYEGIHALGNEMGYFIAVDLSYKSFSGRSMAQILVELDHLKALYDSINLVGVTSLMFNF